MMPDPAGTRRNGVPTVRLACMFCANWPRKTTIDLLTRWLIYVATPIWQSLWHCTMAPVSTRSAKRWTDSSAKACAPICARYSNPSPTTVPTRPSSLTRTAGTTWCSRHCSSTAHCLQFKASINALMPNWRPSSVTMPTSAGLPIER